jgi:capsular polysaccharide transport system permease protein
MSAADQSEQAGGLLESLAIQRRVIGALLMREVITRFGRENIGVLWLVGEPVIFTLGVAALWSALDLSHGSSMPIIAFAITGYSSVLMWRNSVNRCSDAIKTNINLMFHRNVRLLDVFAARIIIEMAGATGSFFLLAILFTSIEWMAPPVDLSLVVQGWLLLAWFGAALATLVGVASAYSDLVERVWHPIAYLLFPLSGAAFMVDWLPPSAREYALMLPMVHGVELLREGYFGNSVRTHHDAGYMATINLVLTFLAMALMKDAARRVEAR